MHTSTRYLSKTEVKSLVDASLAGYFAERKTEALPISPRYEALWEALEKLVLAGGKRFRPYMTLLSFSAYSRDDSSLALPAAVAQELLHSAMLIHDDIIDRDEIRYGVKNIQGQYKESYKPLIAIDSEKQHFATSAALLAGDALLSDAHAQLWRLELPVERVKQAHDILSKAIRTVIGGELIDTEAAFLPKGIVLPSQIALTKTASYSFVSPLTMGAALAGAPLGEIRQLEAIGEKIGLAYQLRDDLLGVFGDESVTGKSTSSDIREGKFSSLIEVFNEIATPEQKARLGEAFQNVNTTEQELEQARHALDESGAKDHIESQIAELQHTAITSLEHLTVDQEAKRAFEHCINECLERSY